MGKSGFRLKLKPKNYASFLVIGIVFVLLIVFYYTGSLPRSYARMFHQIAYSILLAVSLNLVVGYLGELSLGHAGFMCVGAFIGCYCGNFLYDVIPVPLIALILSMLIGGIVAALFGFLIGLPALRLKGDYLAIVTLAFGEIVRTVIENIDALGGPIGLTVTTYSDSLVLVTFAVLLVSLLIMQNLIRSKHGRAITAIRDSEIAARASGINVTYYKILTFVVAAFFAGVAGVLYAGNTAKLQSSTFSYNYSIEILVMVVLGGMGSFNGSIIAAALLAYINYKFGDIFSGDLAALRNIIYALVLIVIVIVNNAPKFQAFRDRFNFHTFGTFIASAFGKLFAKIRKQSPEEVESEIVDHPADWSDIPTKVEMDAILSVDIRREESADLKSQKGREES